ncbi:hypothetical protein BCY86_04585 [Pajaroellobacter abortibovis]|uniref:NIF system FeS cluster assembly NifU C-terminal domain-containing protein n=2 Tax=Pajaroellobacter abortibovis TaxID=1882918 RepID=A0A1L6MX71_9BACT|nr:hypothetical protein BCY86_04585 [Pajaroellobacter abortibovis]
MLCRQSLSHLIESDGGSLYLLSFSEQAIHLLLSDHCAGCPGFSWTRQYVIEPIFRNKFPNVKICVTTGYCVPAHAIKL